MHNPSRHTIIIALIGITTHNLLTALIEYLTILNILTQLALIMFMIPMSYMWPTAWYTQNKHAPYYDTYSYLLFYIFVSAVNYIYIYWIANSIS